MKSYEQKREELSQKYDKQLAALENEKAILDNLPDGLDVEQVYGDIGYRAKGSIKLTVRDRYQAFRAKAKFETVQLVKSKDGTTSLEPVDTAKGSYGKTYIGDYFWSVEWYKGHASIRPHTDTCMTFWAEVGGIRCQVKVVVENDPATMTGWGITSPRDNKGGQHRFWVVDRPATDSWFSYAGGERGGPGRYIYHNSYSSLEDAQASGPDLREMKPEWFDIGLEAVEKLEVLHSLAISDVLLETTDEHGTWYLGRSRATVADGVNWDQPVVVSLFDGDDTYQEYYKAY